MSGDTDDTVVTHDTGHHRYEILLDGTVVGRAEYVDDHEQRGLAARAEALGDQLGGLALGGVAGGGGVGGEGQLQLLERDREGTEGHHDHQHHKERRVTRLQRLSRRQIREYCSQGRHGPAPEDRFGHDGL